MAIGNEPTNFDEANEAVNNMFAEQTEEQTGEQPPSETPSPADETLRNVPDEPSPAPQPVSPQPDAVLQQAIAENQSLKQRMQQLEQTITQMSDAQKQNVVEEALAMPTLDLSSIAFDDEATLQSKQADFTRKMADYMRAEMMRDLSPVLQYAREGMSEKKKAEVLRSLSAVPEFQDIPNMMPQIEKIMANNKMLSSSDMPLDEKYVTAYLIASGLNGKSKKADEMTPEKFMQYYQSNPQLRDIIDKHRLQEINGAKNVPQMTASSGAVNAALNVPKTPTSFDEAYNLSKKYFE